MSSRRSRSFEGCWTCRKRRVRCDGGKPSCKRCATRGSECSGYGFRFDIPPGVQSSRQRLAADSRPNLDLRLTSEEIVQHLHDIDASADSREIGPFSVISFTPCGRGCDGETEKEQDHEGNALLQHRPGDPQSHLYVPGPQKPLALFYLAAQERHLFEHCITFVADQLLPFADFGSEDYCNAGPSVALKGRIFEAADMEVDATHAVFHSICSVGAHSLSKTTGQIAKYDYLALCHENLALHHLQRCIASGCTSYLAMATTIMYFCIGEQVVRHNRWPWEHTNAGVRCLLLALPKEGCLDSYTASICGQYVHLGLLRTDIHAKERQIVMEALVNSLGPDGHQKFIVDLRIVRIIYTIHETVTNVVPCHLPTVSSELTHALDLTEPSSNAPNTRQLRVSRVLHQAARIIFLRHFKRARSGDLEPLVEKFLDLLEQPHDKNDESQNTQVAMPILIINMHRIAPLHEERLSQWLRGRFVPSLGQINYSLDMIKGYWRRECRSEYDPPWMIDTPEAGQHKTDNVCSEKILALHHNTLSV